jgi:hypothetical protein
MDEAGRDRDGIVDVGDGMESGDGGELGLAVGYDVACCAVSDVGI